MTVARSNSNFGIKRPFKVLVCLVTLWSFLFNTVSFDLAWAARAPLELSGDGSNRAGGPGVVKELRVDTFTLPEYLGRIKDSWRGNSDKIVIHIQDAHCNYAAQHKISEIIEYLNKEYGINVVNLEGGAKEYDLSIFTDIVDKSLRDKVADYFVKEGLVNGAEYFAVNNPEKVNLWGIEDANLYVDNLKVYRDSLAHKEEIDKNLMTLSYILSNLKSKVYSKELLDFDIKYDAYKASNIEFKDYLSFLIVIAKSKAIDINTLSNIYLLNQTLEKEGKIEFKKANNERDDLIDRLQKKLSKNALKELVVKIVEFRSKKISQENFYSYLTTKVKDKEITLSEFPEFQKYIVYISMYNTIDKTKVMEEMDTLENKVRDVLCRNDKERQLSTLSKNLSLLKNIFSITLTRDDYKYYKTNEECFNIHNFSTFINKNAPLYDITAKLDNNVWNIDQYRKEIERFYEYSLKRDSAFLNNLRMTKSAVIVTGGFHAENLTGLFNKNGISYISIMPNFKNCDGYECPYFKLLSGKYNVKDIETNAKKALGMALATTGVLNSLSDPELHDAVVRVCRSITPQTSTAVSQPVVVSAKPPAVVVHPEMRTIKELAQDFHFGGNEAALLLWVAQVSKMSGKSQDQIIAEMAKNVEASTDGTVVRYGDLPEERWIYLLSMAKLASETDGTPLFIERGMHPYAALWPQLRQKLASLGISVREDFMATKLVDNAQQIVKKFSPDKRLSVMSAALLTLLTPEERARVITEEEKKVLREIWLKIEKSDQEVVNTYLHAWMIGSFEELLKRKRLTVGLLVKYLADAGIAPEFTRTQFQVEEIYKILSHNYDETTVQRDGLPTYLRIREQLLRANKSFHPRLQFSNAEIGELDEIFKAAGLAEGAIQRDADNFFNSKLWLSFIQGFREQRKQYELIRSPRHIVSPILAEVLKGMPSLRRFQGNALLIFDDAAGTGTAMVSSKLIAKIVSPQTQPRTGLFVVNKKAKGPPFPVDFAGNVSQVYPFEDRSDLYGAFYETRVDGIDELPVIVRTTYDELKAGWLKSVENIPDQQRLYEQYLAHIQQLIKNHGNELFGDLQYLSRARKSAEFDLQTEIVKAYFRGENDPVYRLVFPGFFASYIGELDKINWDIRSKILKDVDLTFARLKVMEESSVTKVEFEELRPLESQIGPLDKAHTIEKLQKLYQEEIERQNNGLSLLDDPKIAEAVKLYFMGEKSFDVLKREIMSQADFSLFKLSSGTATEQLSETRKTESDSRGISGRPNADYTKPVKEAIDEGRFSAVTVHSGIAIPQPSFKGTAVFGKITLQVIQLAVLNNALSALTDEEKGLLQNSIILFIPDLDNTVYNGRAPPNCYGTHYGIQRDQYYFDITRLTDARELSRQLHHEIQERKAVVNGITAEERAKPSDQRAEDTRSRINEIASAAHNSLIAETNPAITNQIQSSPLSEILPLLEAPKIDRVALVHAVSGKVKGVEEIREIISAIETLPLKQRAEAQMAPRTAIAVGGVGDLEPGHLNVVAQCAGIGEGDSAISYNRKIEDILEHHYNGVLAKSIIGKDVTDVETLTKLLVRAREALDSSREPLNGRALLLLPVSLQNVFWQAAEKAAIGKNGIMDYRFKVQFVDQGTMPDYVNQFILGLEILEYVRNGARPNEASQHLINLLTAMADGQNPQDILKKLFEFDFTLKIRKIDWQSVVEQRRAWEAVATAL